MPCTRALTKQEVESEYERNTGAVIAERFASLDADAIPAVLVKNHGPFTWGKDAEYAVNTAITLEEVAKMATLTCRISEQADPVDGYLLEKHYMRKHGKNAYYGQSDDALK